MVRWFLNHAPGLVVALGALLAVAPEVWKTRLGRRKGTVLFASFVASVAGGIWGDIRQETYQDVLRAKDEEIASTVTGGDSYAYVSLATEVGPEKYFSLVHQGAYPLYDITIRIVDLDRLEEVQRSGSVPSNLVMFRRDLFEGQGYASMSPAAKEFEKLILGRQLAHARNPVLTWMASNVAIKEDPAGNIKPDKAKSRDRIDGIVALLMAVGRQMVHLEVMPGIWAIR